MKLIENAEPGDGTVIHHGEIARFGKVESAHHFHRIRGAWYCSCGRKAPWAWPNVVAYVNARGPIRLTEPPTISGGQLGAPA